MLPEYVFGLDGSVSSLCLGSSWNGYVLLRCSMWSMSAMMWYRDGHEFKWLCGCLAAWETWYSSQTSLEYCMFNLLHCTFQCKWIHYYLTSKRDLITRLSMCCTYDLIWSWWDYDLEVELSLQHWSLLYIWSDHHVIMALSISLQQWPLTLLDLVWHKMVMRSSFILICEFWSWGFILLTWKLIRIMTLMLSTSHITWCGWTCQPAQSYAGCNVDVTGQNVAWHQKSELIMSKLK